jgi:aspartokinase
MKKISDATREIVNANPLFHFGLHHRLLNLSQVARYILPLVEARAQKEVGESAVLMSLSRLQSALPPVGEPEDYVLNRIAIHSGLCSLTVFKTKRVQGELNRLYNAVRKQSGFISITESASEVTAIIDDRNFNMAEHMFSEPLRYVYRDIVAVGVKLSEEAISRPGVIYQLIGQVTLQHINIIEVASTATEFSIYVQSEDALMAMDSIYARFAAQTRDVEF